MFHGAAIDITWVPDEEHGDGLLLSAAAPLQAGWRLAREAVMDGALYQSLLLEWGPSAAAHALKGGPPSRLTIRYRQVLFSSKRLLYRTLDCFVRREGPQKP